MMGTIGTTDSGARAHIGRNPVTGRRLLHTFRMWLRKHLTRTMARLEHGHGPGTLRRFQGTYPGYDWKCERCGKHSEWGDE